MCSMQLRANRPHGQMRKENERTHTGIKYLDATAGCGSTDAWIHIGTGPGHIEGHVEGGWTHRKGPKCIGMHQFMSKHVQTVVGGLGKALACGYASVQVGACRCAWIHIGTGPGHIERHVDSVEGGWMHGKGLKRVSTRGYMSEHV